MLKYFLYLCIFNYWEKYTHPKPNELFKNLSLNLRKETQKNFYILQNGIYEHNLIKEKLHNNSIYVKNKLLENKMNNKRKIDKMFNKHSIMIQNLHNKANNNILTLEKTRKKVSDNLADLKTDYLQMQEKLKNNQKNIDKIIKDKKNNHLDNMENNYIKWKNKRQEIEDIINTI